MPRFEIYVVLETRKGQLPRVLFASNRYQVAEDWLVNFVAHESNNSPDLIRSYWDKNQLDEYYIKPVTYDFRPDRRRRERRRPQSPGRYRHDERRRNTDYRYQQQQRSYQDYQDYHRVPPPSQPLRPPQPQPQPEPTAMWQYSSMPPAQVVSPVSPQVPQQTAPKAHAPEYNPSDDPYDAAPVRSPDYQNPPDSPSFKPDRYSPTNPFY